MKKKDFVECECGGKMTLAPGGETAKMLSCQKCHNYYYKVGGITCVLDKMPKDRRAADKLLGGSQPIKPKWAERINKTRKMLKLRPL